MIVFKVLIIIMSNFEHTKLFLFGETMDYLIYGLAHCLASGKYQTLSLKTRH